MSGWMDEARQASIETREAEAKGRAQTQRLLRGGMKRKGRRGEGGGRGGGGGGGGGGSGGGRFGGGGGGGRGGGGGGGGGGGNFGSGQHHIKHLAQQHGIQISQLTPAVAEQEAQAQMMKHGEVSARRGRR